MVDEIAVAAGSEERITRRPNPIDIHVGSRVRLRRMMLSMSQEKLGERLGLTFQQVQKYEKGINRIGASRLFDMSHVLGVPVQYFYDDGPGSHAAHNLQAGGFAETSSETYLVDFLNSREGIELNRSFMRINDAKVRRSVIELVRTLVGETNGLHPILGAAADRAR